MTRQTKRIVSQEDEEDDEEMAQPTKKSTPPSKKSKMEDVEPPKLKKTKLDFNYTDCHRATLQYLLTKKTVEKGAFEEVVKELGWESSLNILVEQINAKLDAESLHMHIQMRKMLEDEAQQVVYGIVNTRNDAVAKEGTSLEQWQVVLFNECLQALAKSETGTISHSEAIHAYGMIPDNSATKSGNDIQQALVKLASLGWLKEISKNTFTVDSRTMLELSEVLREYGAPECPLSKQIVIPTPDYRKWLSSRAAPE